MDRQLLNNLVEYFSAIAEPTEKEKELMAGLEREIPHFAIAYIDRIFIKCANYRADLLSDSDMNRIAFQMGRAYCGSKRPSIDIRKACKEIGIKKNPKCPKCGNASIYDLRRKTFRCESCSQEWSNRYTLVEAPEETDQLPGDLGYPSSGSLNSNARYIPEYDYIRIFGKAPASNSYYEPITWPESQMYMTNNDGDAEDGSVDALNELINDPAGIGAFGLNAYWVPLCNLK